MYTLYLQCLILFSRCKKKWSAANFRLELPSFAELTHKDMIARLYLLRPTGTCARVETGLGAHVYRICTGHPRENHKQNNEIRHDAREKRLFIYLLDLAKHVFMIFIQTTFT